MIVQYTIIYELSSVVNCILQIGDFFSVFFEIQPVFGLYLSNIRFDFVRRRVAKRPAGLFVSFPARSGFLLFLQYGRRTEK